MKTILPLILVAIISVCASFKPSADHEFYVSITEMEIKQDTLQISVRLFVDDLEYALNERNDAPVFLNDPSNEPKNFIKIRDYVSDHFSAGDAAKPKKAEWIGHEYEDDVCWVYGQVPVSRDLGILFVKNELLMDVYSRQQNIMHLKSGDDYETKLATKDNSEVRFVLK